MKDKSKDKINRYNDVSKKITAFAFDYHKKLEESIPKNKNFFIKLLSKTLHYPSNFMLKYNGVKRIREICAYFLVYAVADDCPLGGTAIIEQVQGLKDVFVSYYDVEDILVLIFSLISTSFLGSAIYYIITFLQEIQFDFNILIIAGLIAVILILSYNFLEYDRLRGKLKTRFTELKKEIQELPIPAL